MEETHTRAFWKTLFPDSTYCPPSLSLLPLPFVEPPLWPLCGFIEARNSLLTVVILHISSDKNQETLLPPSSVDVKLNIIDDDAFLFFFLYLCFLGHEEVTRRIGWRGNLDV